MPSCARALRRRVHEREATTSRGRCWLRLHAGPRARVSRYASQGLGLDAGWAEGAARAAQTTAAALSD